MTSTTPPLLSATAVEMCLLIAGMAFVTYISRSFPMLMLSSRTLAPWVTRWLQMAAPAIFGALLAPALFLVYKGEPGTASYVKDYSLLLATIPAFIVGWFTKTFIGTIATGMAAMALLRYLGM